jgi:hypothetical protein
MNLANKPRIGQELLDVPMGDMIKQMAFAIAESQIKLDENSIDIAQMMGGVRRVEDENGNVSFEDSRVYFGKEKLSVEDGINLFNSSNDQSLKAVIKTQLGLNATNDDAHILNATSDAARGIDVSKVYKVTTGSGTSTTNNYYVYIGKDSLNNNTYKTVTFESIERLKKSTTATAVKISVPNRLSMLELGFTPTFYQFVDTIIEVKISIRYSMESESNVSVSNTQRNANANLRLGFGRARAGVSVSTTQVNASYSQKFSYSAEGSSLLRTKLVPIPPPAILEDRIRRMLDSEFSNPQ